MRINTEPGETQADAIRHLDSLSNKKCSEQFLEKMDGIKIHHTNDRSVWKFFDGSEYILIK